MFTSVFIDGLFVAAVTLIWFMLGYQCLLFFLGHRYYRQTRLARKQGMYSVISATGLILRRGHELAQVLVGYEDDRAILRQRLHQSDRVGARTTVVALGLYVRRAVDVADDERLRVLLFEAAQLLGGNHVGHRAPRPPVRQQHPLAG